MKRKLAHETLPKNFANFLKRFRSPRHIQDYLDKLKYNTSDCTRSPLNVWKTGEAHCYDGALFGAAALRMLGYPPLILDMRTVNDDDHVLALFRENGAWGTLGKSNYSGLQFREPIYRNLRELSISFFDLYFNLARQKTLREYSLPFDLRRVDHLNWMTQDDSLDEIADIFDGTRHFRLLTKQMEKNLSKIDDRVFRSMTLGIDKKGAFKVKK